MADREDHNLHRELGVSRRDMLKRGAVVGGTLMWSAPVILSLGPSAFAAGTLIHHCCYCYTPEVGQTVTAQCVSASADEACASACASLKYLNYSYCSSASPTNCTESEGCNCP